MALSFACHECGEQRTLNADGGADPCPSCGAGLPGESPDQPNTEGDAADADSSAEEAADSTPAEDDGLPGEPLSPAGEEAEVADAAAASSASDVEAPPVHAPPVQAVADELEDFDEGEEAESVDLSPKNGREEGDMDMTPMVDVTFLLLIFFMITAAFSLQKSIEIPKPEETDQASTQVREEIEDNQDYITVIIDQFNTFRVQTADSEEEAPGKHDLLRKLRRARDNAPSPDQIPSKLLVKAHGDATHERVVIALDAGVEVGMEQVQLMTVEEDL